MQKMILDITSTNTKHIIIKTKVKGNNSLSTLLFIVNSFF